MNIIIVDDMTDDGVKLKALIEKYAHESLQVINVYMFRSGEEFLAKANLLNVDIIFLDIYMENLTGMEVATCLRKNGCSVPIVFLTTSRTHAVQSYEVRALDYVIKPIAYEKLVNIMTRLRQDSNNSPKYIKVKEGRDYKKILVPDIIYVDYHNHYVQIHTNKQMVKTYQKFSEFEQEMSQHICFLTCHRCIMINMDMVERLEKGLFLMKNGEYIPINRKYIKEVKMKYLEYIFGKIGRESIG